MFTLRKREKTPELSVVTGDPRILSGEGAPKVTHTPAGELVQTEIDTTKTCSAADSQ